MGYNGTNNAGRYRLDQKTVDEIRRLRMLDKELWTIVKLADRFGTSISQISKICNRRQRQDVRDIYDGSVNLRG